ncbi:hypothetical protein LTS10_004522 [Elasticomyces elasticus]|nr:hypothetical protein LTS10_004522 [Elasticomyces elasticus]
MSLQEIRRATREAIMGLDDQGYIHWLVEQESIEMKREAAAAAEARKEALLSARELQLLWDIDDAMVQMKEELATEETPMYNVPEFTPREALLSLPPELAERVTTFLPPSDLLALRATCRDLEAKTRRPFIDANMVSKTFLLSDQESMQVLVEISAHSIFGAAVKNITLVPWQLRGIKDHRSMRVEEAERQQLTAREIRKSQREAGHDYARIHAAQKDYLTGDEWHIPLAEAMANFARSGNTLSIELATRLQRPESACGAARLSRVVGYSSALVCRRDIDLLVPEMRFLRTVLASGCRIEKARRYWVAEPTA